MRKVSLRRVAREGQRARTDLHLSNEVVLLLLDVLELVKDLIDFDLLERRVVVFLELVGCADSLSDVLSILDGGFVNLKDERSQLAVSYP
jgi:hypothetical protein